MPERITRIMVIVLLVAGLQPAFAEEALKNLKGLAIEAYHPDRGMNFSETTAQDFRRLNVQVIRVEMIQEYSGQIDYSKYDAIVDRAAEYGMEILGLIDYQSIPWTDTDEWGTAEFRSRFVNRVEEIVTHFKDRSNPIKHWEVWNEPDLDTAGFDVRIEPVPYADLLIASYDKIRSLDPSAVVLFGGVSPKGFEYWPPQENYIDEVYSTPAIQNYYTTNGHYPFDVMAIHPYPETFTNPAFGNLADVVDDKVIAVMDSHGDTGKKIWLTEMGWNSAHVSEKQQANYLTSSYTICRDDLPRVEKYIWFKYDEWEDNLWGLVTADHSRRKPSYDAYYNLAPGPDPDEADSSLDLSEQ